MSVKPTVCYHSYHFYQSICLDSLAKSLSSQVFDRFPYILFKFHFPGSSNGIGRGTALLFAQEGAKVTVTGRNEARLLETKQKILDSGIPEDHVLTVVADLSADAGQDDLINATITKFGRLDILVNNAGAAFNDEQFNTGVSQNISVYDKVLQINLRSVVTLTQKAKDHLIASKGEIVNVSSIAAGPQSVNSSSLSLMLSLSLLGPHLHVLRNVQSRLGPVHQKRSN